MDDSVWHIVRVKPGKEDEIARASGAPAYVPKKLVTYFNRRLRKVIKYIAPIFQGFVFMRVPAPSALKMPPSKDFYGFMRNRDRSPAVLSAKAFGVLKQIEALAQQAQPETETVPQKPVLKVGQQLSLVLAADKAVDAIISFIRGDKILAEIVGTSVRVELNSSSIVAT